MTNILDFDKERVLNLYPIIDEEDIKKGKRMDYLPISDEEEEINLFVYGTLLPGNHMYDSLFSGLDVKQLDGVVNGTLYSVNGAFPGLVEGSNDVEGKMYQVTGSQREIFELLNGLHGYESAIGKNPLYRFEELEVRTNEGEYKAYAYIFNRSTEGLTEIKSGSWLKPKGVV